MELSRSSVKFSHCRHFSRIGEPSEIIKSANEWSQMQSNESKTTQKHHTLWFSHRNGERRAQIYLLWDILGKMRSKNEFHQKSMHFGRFHGFRQIWTSLAGSIHLLIRIHLIDITIAFSSIETHSFHLILIKFNE